MVTLLKAGSLTDQPQINLKINAFYSYEEFEVGTLQLNLKFTGLSARIQSPRRRP